MRALAATAHVRASVERRGAWWRTAALAAALSCVSVATLRLAGSEVRMADSAERLYLPTGQFLREAAVGFREMAADWLWFQVIQYYGEHRQGRHGLEYFTGLIRGVTQLDPRFVEAYRFGALVIATDMGDVRGGEEILKRGILANPDRWILPFEVGFLHYVLSHDPERAAAWFEAAARAPDATDFARRFAAFAYDRAGQVEVSLVLWRNLRETTGSPAMQELADRNIARCENLLRDGRRAPVAGRAADAVGKEDR